LIIIRAFVPLSYHQGNFYAIAAFKEEGGNELEVGSSATQFLPLTAPAKWWKELHNQF
jgi:hypothetical protein